MAVCITVFLTYVHLVKDNHIKNVLFCFALIHCAKLYEELEGDLPCHPTMLPVRAMVTFWCDFIHTQYRTFRTSWAIGTNAYYDFTKCDCPLCKPVALITVFPPQFYWKLLESTGIKACFCTVCRVQPQCPNQPQPGPSRQSGPNPTDPRFLPGPSKQTIPNPSEPRFLPGPSQPIATGTQGTDTPVCMPGPSSKSGNPAIFPKYQIIQTQPVDLTKDTVKFPQKLIPLRHGRPIASSTNFSTRPGLTPVVPTTSAPATPFKKLEAMLTQVPESPQEGWDDVEKRPTREKGEKPQDASHENDHNEPQE